MRYIILTWFVLWGLIVAVKATGEPQIPPYAAPATEGKVCVAIFDKFGELIGIECDVPQSVESGKKEPIRKGP